jgi:predicted dienelactone hydrolase
MGIGNSQRWRIGAIAAALFWGVSPAQAADTIVLRYGDSQDVIEVEEIEELIETGEVSPSLEKVSQTLSQKQREQILAALQVKQEIDPDRVSEFLDTEMGERVLRAIAALTGKENALQLFFLRLALVHAARNADLSIVGFLEAYPEDEIEINLDKAFLVVQNFNTGFWQTQAFMLAIAPQLAPNRPPLELPFDPTQPGNERVQTLNLNLDDKQRARQIPVKIHFSPTASGRKPLIIFSHGLFSVNQELRYLAEHLASYGYVVVIPEHPGSNETHLRQVLGNLNGPLLDTDSLFDPANLLRLLPLLADGKLLEPEELLNRPRDLSFVLDELHRLNPTLPQLRGKLATDNVLVLGYSLGGATALTLAGAEWQLEGLKQQCQERNLLASNLSIEAQCIAKNLPENRYQLRDPRIKAAIALSPTTSLLFGPTGLSQVKVPILITAASADKTTPALTEQIIAFSRLPDPKWLAGILGGTHLSVKDPGTTLDQAGQPDTIYSGGEVVGLRAFAARNYIKAIALAMAAQLTDEAKRYAIFLTPDYAELASTPRLDFRLVRDIPPEVEATLEQFGRGER